MKTIDFPSGRYVITAEISERPDFKIYAAQRLYQNEQTGSYRVYCYPFPAERLPLIKNALILTAQKLCRLNHPCVETYIDYTSGAEQRLSGDPASANSETVFFALLQQDDGGISLEDMIRNRYVISVAQWMNYFTDALRGLDNIQQSNILCHGNISAENILLSDRKHIRLTGFNFTAIALNESPGIQDNRFAAPEAGGRTLTLAMDMYALATSFIQLASQIRRNRPVACASIENLIEPLPKNVRSLLTDMTELEPSERLASADQALKRIKRHTGNIFKNKSVWITTILLCLVLALAGWDYHQFRRPRDREIMTLGGWFSGHGNPVSPVTRMLFGDEDLILDNGTVCIAAFHPSGKRLISNGPEGMILWNLENEHPDKKMSYDDYGISYFWRYPLCFQYSADGRKIFLGYSSSLHTLDADALRPVNEFNSRLLAQKIRPGNYGSFAAVTTDKKQSLLAALDVDSSIILYDLPADSQRWSLRPVIHFYCIFSPLGDYLLIRDDNYDSTMHFINADLYCVSTEEPEKVRIFRFDENFFDFAVTPDMSRMIFYNRGLLSVFHFDTKETKQLPIKSVHSYYEKITASPDSRRVACLSQNYKGHSIILYDLDSGRIIADFPCHDERIYSVGFSHDGKRLFTTSGDQTVKIWDISE